MAILNSRAATGPEPVYLLPGEVTDVPRADIEIDVDMESTNDGVSMWGAYVTDRANTAITAEGDRAFLRWEPHLLKSETFRGRSHQVSFSEKAQDHLPQPADRAIMEGHRSG